MRYQELTEGKRITANFGNLGDLGVNIWKNPSKQQLYNLVNKVSYVRGFEEHATKDFYIWDAHDANHGAIIAELGADWWAQTGFYLSKTASASSWTWNDALRKINDNLYIGIGGEGSFASGKSQEERLAKLITNKKIKFALGL